MSSEDGVKNLLNIYFKAVRQEFQSLAYDFTAKTRQGECKVYIECHLHPLSDREFYLKAMRLKDVLSAKNDFPECAIIITEQSKRYKFAVAAYTDNERSNVKRVIDWRDLNMDNIERLNCHLGAKRNQLEPLPSQYFRVVKCITFRGVNFEEGVLVYLRKFREGYKMTPQKNISEQERFNQLLYGTPESDYPSDVLDEIILKTIQTQYPNASTKSHLMLFNVDLLNYRSYLMQQRQVVSFEIKENETLKENFELEIYYYPDLFKKTIFNIQDQSLVWLEKGMSIAEIKKTYEPLSAMNL